MPVPTCVRLVADPARTAGMWSAWAAALLAIAYDLGQFAEWFGWLGSKGGPESSSTPLGIAILLTPSLFLGPAFLLTIVCIHELAAPEVKFWTRAAIAFATIYAALITITYYVQLTWVGPRLAAGRTAGMEQFLFVPFDSFLYAVDILGYSFMSVATFFAAMIFAGEGTEKRARWLLIANGAILPFLALQMFWHSLIWIAASWAVIFPAAMIAVAGVFRDAKTIEPQSVAAATR